MNAHNPDYVDELDRCENFGDVFDIVKRSVQQSLGERRAGLMLYLAELPLNVGAFHGVGTNAIVVNRALLDIMVKSGLSRREMNSYLYSILLHEYLHSLGHIDEQEVRELVSKVTRLAFGEAHPATRMAAVSPAAFLPKAPIDGQRSYHGSAEIVRDFDRSNQGYIG